MKKILWLVLLAAAVEGAAYQTGSVSRPNFSASPANAEEEKAEQPSVPGQKKVQTRSFTSYGARQGNTWRQGVQTKTVQTKTAGTVQEKEEKQAPAAAALKGSVSASSKTKPAASAAPAQPAPAAAAPAAAAGADPAAVMQQLQGLQNMMGAFGGNPGAAAPKDTKGGKPENTGAAAMPAGMPDISSLMNMAGSANTGKK